MEVSELLDELKIDKSFKENKKGQFVIELENSDEYAKMYTKLDNSDKVNLDQECVIVSPHSNIMTYFNEEFDVTLEANFDSDTYRIVIERAEDK